MLLRPHFCFLLYVFLIILFHYIVCFAPIFIFIIYFYYGRDISLIIGVYPPLCYQHLLGLYQNHSKKLRLELPIRMARVSSKSELCSPISRPLGVSVTGAATTTTSTTSRRCQEAPCHHRAQGGLVNPFGYPPLSDYYLSFLLNNNIKIHK